MFRNTQKEFIKIQDVEVILKSFKQVLSITFDGEFYMVRFGDNIKSSMVKFIIKEGIVISQELLSVSEN